MPIDRFFSVFKTAGRGLAAQRKQLSIASENIANAQTTQRADGKGPYRPKYLQASTGGEDRFRRTLKASILDMERTNSSHRSGPQPASSSGAPVDLGPQTEVVEQEQFRFEYDPGHPDADENGMVKYPDVDMVEEMTRMVSANRLYEANLSVIQAEKSIIKSALEI
ncbi:flagellar basal body rod protein FlgC [Fodinibius sediminis]|uniref:Flagellar basal-body rod protein FlgC n=1 Tax=Fodinibius sediminis TaxID=1214077 RepID=A0A521CJA5_9BACT|nr:flagellar basal body rod protein FlgC [Fodinibius sediminis]SMO59465.1 flagellar basal-body rod protein FlgC [Fodinibius sediminis]